MHIIICSHPDNKEFLENLLFSLEGVKYPYSVFMNDKDNSGYELGVLKRAYEEIRDDLFFLQDTCEIKNKEMFDYADNQPGGVAICDRFMSYLGKYKRDVLAQMVFPEVKDKEQSIHHEGEFNRRYIKLDKDFSYFPQRLHDSNVFEEKFGRQNMILENDFIIKYKFTYR